MFVSVLVLQEPLNCTLAFKVFFLLVFLFLLEIDFEDAILSLTFKTLNLFACLQINY